MENMAMQTILPIHKETSFAQILCEFKDLDIRIFASGRLKRTWRIERKINKYSLVIPKSFLDASDDMKRTLLMWAQLLIKNKLNRKNADISVKKQIKNYENEIYAFIKKELGLDNKKIIVSPQTKFRYTDGHKFDLSEIFSKLNKKYFNGELECFLRWGKAGSRTSYHTICNDENGEPFHLITIAGMYNLLTIPDFAIESVMYHEMLHIAYPPKISGTQRNVHHKQFREKERQFPYYEKWKTWQRKILIKKVF
jgi:hypothetical protein